MKTRSKKYNQSFTKIDAKRRYGCQDGLTAIRECREHKFDETVDLSFKLGIDPRQADQQIRGSYSLPHGTGKSKKVIVFAKDQKIQSYTFL